MPERLERFRARAVGAADRPGGGVPGLVAKLLLVAIVCYLSTEIGFAHKLPPHNLSALWPTNAILFGVLVATPPRLWWAYTFAAYFSSLVNDARAGFPVSGQVFLLADVVEVVLGAAGVRRFAGGLRAFTGLRSLAAYLLLAVLAAPFVSAFVGALAGTAETYWFYWRAWFLSEALAFLVLAPAVLAWIDRARAGFTKLSVARCLEAGLIGCGLLAVGAGVFISPAPPELGVPALVYMPLPFLLWAAVRFGSIGVGTSLLVIASLSISGVVHGRGPFAATLPAEGLPSLQLFLFTLSLPLMFLGALIEERRERMGVLRESEARFRMVADTAPVLIWMSGPDKRGTFFNRGWLEFTGRTMEQEVGDGWSQGVHPDDLDRCLDTYIRSFDQRLEFAMEYRLRRHDGAYRWILDRGVPRRGTDGTFLGYVGCCDDITDLRQAMAEIRELKDRVELENAYLRQEVTVSRPHEGVVGEGAAIMGVLNQVGQVAGTSSAVLVLGETGVGKELVARAIHRLSPRRSRALVKVNCAALPSALVESELFGREKGAYTGALTRQAGRFEMADASTIFLDEVGELPLELQSKLLRVLQDGELERLGSAKTIRVDVRVIAATNRDLASEVKAGRFREDLFYRLNVFPIVVPPLRARREDIPLLVWAFVREFEVTMGKRIETIPRKDLDALVAHAWPGNVRELRNAIERAMIVSPGPVLRVEIPPGPGAATHEDDSAQLHQMERRHILAVLDRAGWRIRGPQGAASVLGLKPTTLEARMAKLGIKRAPGGSLP